MPVSWLGCWAALETSVSHAESAGDRPTKGHLPKRGFGHVAVLGMSQRPIHLPQERRIAPSKLTGYLLHPSNSQGKAAFFQRMGFSLENWPALQQALLMHAESATLIDVLAGHKGLLTLISPVRSLRVGAQKADRGVANPRWVTDPAAVGALR